VEGPVTRAAAVRAQALRRARAAAASGEAERQLRQRRVETALASYFEAADRAGKVRSAARARAAAILAAAEESAAGHDAAACAAVARLRELGEVNARIAGLCGISVPAVRAMVARTPAAAKGQAVDGRGADGGKVGLAPPGTVSAK
jgi:hypothetical protein